MTMTRTVDISSPLLGPLFSPLLAPSRNAGFLIHEMRAKGTARGIGLPGRLLERRQVDREVGRPHRERHVASLVIRSVPAEQLQLGRVALGEAVAVAVQLEF